MKGVGTQVWIHTQTPKDALNLQTHLRQQGVLVKLNSSLGVVAKPALTLEDSQSAALTRALAKF